MNHCTMTKQEIYYPAEQYFAEKLTLKKFEGRRNLRILMLES